MVSPYLVQDLFIREVTNGFWFTLPVCLGAVFALHAVLYVRGRGWTNDVQVSFWFMVFLGSTAIARAGAWLLLMGLPFPHYGEVAIGTMVVGEVAGARLMYLLAPHLGHKPWIASLTISTVLPIGVVLWREWPAVPW